jgi:putative transposase
VATQPLKLHAFGLRSDELLLVATPGEASALARTLQALGRHFVGAFNRRHGRSGTPWSGRFGSALLEPGASVLQALVLADAAGPEPGLSSAAHHLGLRREAWLHDPPELWQLGNTPFERERAWSARLAEGLGAVEQDALRRAALGGWVYGSSTFVSDLAVRTDRPLRPRARGRPRRPASPPSS